MKSKKILLINPPMEEELDNLYPPMGICSLASYLKERLVEVEILDFSFSGIDKDILKSAMDLFTPDYVGISCITANYQNGITIAQYIKEYYNVKVVFGGLHPTFDAERLLKNFSVVDYVVRGEGELTLYELITEEKPLQDILGISYFCDNKYYKNDDRPFIANLDTLPDPDYSVLPTFNTYLEKNEYFIVVSSRGCPYSCKFCSTNVFWGKLKRDFSAERIFSYIKKIKNKYGISKFLFGDDEFALNKKKLIKICELIIISNLNIEWICSVRADSVDYEILKLMKNAGCKELFVGMESANDRSLISLNKKLTKEDYLKFASVCKEVGIDILASMIIGLPWEKENDVRGTISFIKNRIKPKKVLWNYLHLDIGSEFYQKASEYGFKMIKSVHEKCSGQDPSVETVYLDANAQIELFFEAYMETVDNG